MFKRTMGLTTLVYFVNTVEQHMSKALKRLREGVLVFLQLMLH